MKNILAITVLLSIGVSAFASIPSELQDLIPPGQKDLTLYGKTQDNKSCKAQLAADSYSFSTVIFVMDSQGNVDFKRMGKFQVGFGYNLESLSTEGENTVAISVHQAEEQYSKDERTTLKVNKTENGVIKTVQTIVQEKGFFDYKTVVDETCHIQIK